MKQMMDSFGNKHENEEPPVRSNNLSEYLQRKTERHLQNHGTKLAFDEGEKYHFRNRGGLNQKENKGSESNDQREDTYVNVYY